MNKNELQIFENESFGKVRIIEENGNVLFCGSDVAKALGYTRPNDAINSHCKGDTLKRSIIDSLGRTQKARFITEGDLYRLIVHSKLESAQKFESWVFDEVLPLIRKNKSYSVNNSSFEETLKIIAQNVLLLTEIVKQNSQRLYDLEKRNEIRQAPEMSIRAEINKIIRSYAAKEEISISQAWKELYQEFYYRKHINISKRADRLNISKLDYAEENDLLEDLKLIAQKL